MIVQDLSFDWYFWFFWFLSIKSIERLKLCLLPVIKDHTLFAWYFDIRLSTFHNLILKIQILGASKSYDMLKILINVKKIYLKDTRYSLKTMKENYKSFKNSVLFYKFFSPEVHRTYFRAHLYIPIQMK